MPYGAPSRARRPNKPLPPDTAISGGIFYHRLSRLYRVRACHRGYRQRMQSRGNLWGVLPLSCLSPTLPSVLQCHKKHHPNKRLYSSSRCATLSALALQRSPRRKCSAAAVLWHGLPRSSCLWRRLSLRRCLPCSLPAAPRSAVDGQREKLLPSARVMDMRSALVLSGCCAPVFADPGCLHQVPPAGLPASVSMSHGEIWFLKGLQCVNQIQCDAFFERF